MQFVTSAARLNSHARPGLISTASEMLPPMDSSGDYSGCAGNLVLLLVSAHMDVTKLELTAKTRGKARICIARQCAMYLMHVAFSCTYCEVADFFGRDRTTVSHACRLIEDMRDDPSFERKISRMETFASAAAELANASRNNSIGSGEEK